MNQPEEEIIRYIIDSTIQQHTNAEDRFYKDDVVAVVNEVFRNIKEELYQNDDKTFEEFSLDEKSWATILEFFLKTNQNYITSNDVHSTIFNMINEFSQSEKEEEKAVVQELTPEQMKNVLTERINNIRSKIKGLESEAKNLVAQGDRKAAMAILKRKKLLTNHLEQMINKQNDFHL
ncbi:cysteine tRS [Acrasis kona]|uniref:Cysteine tRS n=1 Tax=Acrasis kona TaxID=1008807 RepID=A0AAW2Z4X0_9EUKA